MQRLNMLQYSIALHGLVRSSAVCAAQVICKQAALMLHDADGPAAAAADILRHEPAMHDAAVTEPVDGELEVVGAEKCADLRHDIPQCGVQHAAAEPFDLRRRMHSTPITVRLRKIFI